jgi:carbon monoxide dehydrogenase subunit G
VPAKLARVKLEGTRQFGAPREEVFAALTDPDLLARALPGVGRVVIESPDRWIAEIKVPLVARAPKLHCTFEIRDRRDPLHARLTAAGKSFGASMNLDTSFDLADVESGTEMHYGADIRLGGLLGRLGPTVVEPVAKRLLNGLLDAVDRRVTR